jgi:hypothetical protein
MNAFNIQPNRCIRNCHGKVSGVVAYRKKNIMGRAHWLSVSGDGNVVWIAIQHMAKDTPLKCMGVCPGIGGFNNEYLNHSAVFLVHSLGLYALIFKA